MKSPLTHSALIAASLFALSTHNADAVLNFLITTDSGISGGSYSGGGTLQTGISSAGTNGDPAQTLVQGVGSGANSGSLTIDSTSLLQDRFLNPDVSVTLNFIVNGGTADILLSNRTNFDGGANRFDSIQLGNFSAGVTGFDVSVTYSEPISARDGFVGGLLNSGPMLSAIGLVSGTANAFSVSTSYSGVFSTTDPMATPTAGLNAAALPNASPGFGTTTAGQLSFSSPGGFSGLINTDLDSDFLLVDGYDLDGTPGRGNGDAPLVYATSQSWDVDGTFDSSTLFTFSLDGQQFANVANIPEASSSILALIGLCGLSFYRRRS